MYSAGESEEIVGKALKGRPRRRRARHQGPRPDGPGPQPARATRALWIMREVEDSLRRLGTDHIDLYQIHRPEGDTDVEETLAALTDLQRQGKIRYFGSSTFPGWQMVEAQWTAERRGLSRFRTEQPPYSIFVRHIEHDVLPVAAGATGWACSCGARSCRGWLTGRYRRDGLRRVARRAGRRAGSDARTVHRRAVRPVAPRDPTEARPGRAAAKIAADGRASR